MNRVVVIALGLLVASGVAAAQDEPDPFADAEDPFAVDDDPFAALEANVVEAEETLAVGVEDSTSADAATEEEAAAPAPAPAAAPAAPAGNDTPGLGIVASLAALLAALAIFRRR